MAGCATPVGINHVDVQAAYRINTASALSVGEASNMSKIVLRRYDLLDKFETQPSAVLAELHAGLKPVGHDTRLFALAELSFLHAQRTNDRAYYLAAAVYAWSLLFPENGNGTRLQASDRRFRLAFDIYNQAIALGLAAPSDDDEETDAVQLKSGKYQLPFGTLELTRDESGMTWGGYPLDRFISTNTIDVRGLRNRYHTTGIGAPLAASLATKPAKKIAGADRLPLQTKVPVTALLRFENPRSSLASGKIYGCIEVYAADKTISVAIDGQQQAIEYDPTAALAYQLNDSPIYAMEISGFLNGTILNGLIPTDRAQDGILTLYPYKTGKIPVVLVHGTASSPARWAELINELNGNAEIRAHFQLWVFIYDSGNPIPYSAGRLRKALIDTIKELDPEGKDAALHNMVVIGHSQGGLLSKFTAIDSGTKFWNKLSNKPFKEVKVSPETRAMLQQSIFFTPLPFVKRLIFISTPQHGAIMAANTLILNLAAKLLTMPVTMMAGLAQLAAADNDEKLTQMLTRPPTSIDNMNPNNEILKILAAIRVPSQTPAHSIIAVTGDGAKEDGDDGVVTYKSAHIDEAVSEKVVRWGHSCQNQPETIEEVKRILFEHLKTSNIELP